VLLHDEIVPANAPFSLFSDDSAHLLQHFEDQLVGHVRHAPLPIRFNCKVNATLTE
jgi:hypothetical protein